MERAHWRSWAAVVLAVAVIAALVPAVAATPVAAQTAMVIDVTSTADDAAGENDAECPHTDNCTLRAAVEAANVEGGDVEIVLPAGHYQLDNEAGALQVSDALDSLTISGAGHGDDPGSDSIIDAGGTDGLDDRILEVDTATLMLAAVRLTGGAANGNGGAILADNAPLRASDVVFIDNQALGSSSTGGAISSDGASEATDDVSIHLTRTEFVANAAPDGWGGAIYHDAVAGVGDLHVTDSRFEDNEASSTGGALFLIYFDSTVADVRFDGVDFVGNDAPGCCGGAANIFGGAGAQIDFLVTDSLFEDNAADDCCGGAVWIDDGSEGTTWAFEDTIWRDNQVGDNTLGGALWMFSTGGASLDLVRNQFLGNEANGLGGAIRADNTAVTILDSVIADNRLTDDTLESGGAAIDVTGEPNEGPTLTVSNTTISGNEVAEGSEPTDIRIGAGIALGNAATAELHHVTLADNVSPDGGDAIYFRDDESQATLTGTVLAGDADGSRCASEDDPGTIIDGGGNVADDDSCGFDAADIHDDLLLDELTQVDRVDGETGTTWVHELLDGSPAIAAVDSADCLETDQRGALRPTDGPCSAGAWEADATVPEPETEACPPGVVPPAGFTDIAGSTHEAAIDCAAWYGITQGVTADLFVPRRATTRQEMASFIARTLEVAGAQLPANPTHGFQDLTGGAHDERIAQLAEVGIIEGRTATRFVPRDHVTRAQTASLLVRAHDWLVAEALPPGESDFTDIAGSVHEDAIEAAASAGLTQGRTSTTFAPQSSTSRDQVASFTTRLLQLFFEEGLVAHPG